MDANLAHKAENKSFEEPCLNLISKKADGSMRDALSLLDQVIAYCEDDINIKNAVKDIYAKSLFNTQEEGLTQFSKINIIDKYDIKLINSWYLRSRVHNGVNGYHLVNLYRINSTDNYFLIKSGWVPLDKNISRTFPYMDTTFIGRLIEYDIQGIGQDDIPGSEYLFRVDKSFIENEYQINLPDYYLVLTEGCGSGVECINLNEPYDAPHLSYAFQWLFFGITLSVVILRKNKLI